MDSYGAVLLIVLSTFMAAFVIVAIAAFITTIVKETFLDKPE